MTSDSKQSFRDRFTRGVAYYRHGRFDQATDELASLAEASDVCSKVARYYTGMAHRQAGLAAMHAGEYARAEACLRQAAAMIADHADLSEYLAAVFARTGRLEKCAAEMSKIHDAKPDDAAIARRTALAQWQTGRRIEAHMTLSNALRRQPGEPQLLSQLGIFHAADERFAQAREAFEQASQMDPGDGEIRYRLGLVAAAMGDTVAAVRALQRAFELRPNDMMLAYQLAIAAKAARQAGHKVVITPPELASGDGSGGRQLSQYIASEPEFIEAFLSLPESEIDLDLFNVLAGAIGGALAGHPNYADLHLYYSRVMKRLGRLEQAVDHAKRALAINPNYVSALIELGRLQAATAEPVSAAASLELAISKGADWPDIHCLAGQTMLQSGQTEKGRRHLARALELRADYAPAKDALEGLAA